MILLQPAAPAKPAPGESCNGCGVCCAAEPCPVGMLISRRRSGACAALRWRAEAGMYRCGLIDEPRSVLPRALRALAPLLQRWARRLISAGSGCDCSLDVAAADGAA